MLNLNQFISKRFAAPISGRFLSFARFVAFFGVMLGVIALLLSLAILYGFEKELRKSAVKFTSHVTLNTFNKQPIKDFSHIIELLNSKFPEIYNITPVIEREGLVKSSLHTDGVVLKSFDHDNDITNFSENIKIGEKTFSSNNAKEVIISNRLARKLGISCGDDIILYSILESSGGGISDSRIGKFSVIGIYETGMAQYDDVMIYLPFASAMDFFRFHENSATKLEIMLDDIEKSALTSQAIMDFLGYPYWTMTFYELHSSIFAWIELQKEPIPIILGLISIVAVLNIITTLLIGVVEKTHSIGILRTLGMKRSDIVSIFVLQGFRLGATGMILGATISLIFSYLQQNYAIIKLKGEIYFLDALPIYISQYHYLIVISISLVLILLSTIIPAIIASSIKPARALRFK